MWSLESIVITEFGTEALDKTGFQWFYVDGSGSSGDVKGKSFRA